MPSLALLGRKKMEDADRAIRSARLCEIRTKLIDIPADLEEAVRPYLRDYAFALLQLAEVPYDAIAGTPVGTIAPSAALPSEHRIPVKPA